MTNIKTDKILNVPTLRFPGFTDEWQKCTISQFGDIITGSTPSTSNQDNYTDGVYCWASPSDLNGTKYVYDTKIRLSQKGYDKTRKLPKDAILVTCIGSTIGKMGMSYTEMSTNQQINAVVVNVSFDKDFVYYAIQSRFPKYLTSIAVQAVPILSKSAFGELGNYYPSKLEQKKIGKLLSLLDERIAMQSKLIEDLKKLKSAIRAAIFQQLKKTTNQMRAGAELLEYEQPTKYLVSGTEYSQDKSLTPVLTANKSLILGYTDEKFGIYKKGDCIILDDFTLDLKYITFPFKVKSSAIKILRAKNGVSLRYMYEYLNWLELTPLGHNRHYISMIEPMQFYCPEVQAQEKIATTLEKADEKIQSESRLFDALTRQKYYLLSAMFI